MKRLFAFLLMLALCIGVSAVGEEALIGCWEFYSEYMDQLELIPVGGLPAYGSMRCIMEFLPDGGLTVYAGGSVTDYTYTENTITVYYENTLLQLFGDEPRMLTKEYAYTLDGDRLLQIYASLNRNVFMIYRRLGDGEGLFGKWKEVASLDEKGYEAYVNGQSIPENGETIWEYDPDGKLVLWEDIVYELAYSSEDYSDAWEGGSDISDWALTYTADGTNMIIIGRDVAETVAYRFEDGRLVLIFTDSYFDGEEQVDTEETIYLKRVS